MRQNILQIDSDDHNVLLGLDSQEHGEIKAGSMVLSLLAGPRWWSMG